MNKKSTLILLSILHICILGVCILTIYSNRHSGANIVHVSFDTGTAVTQKQPGDGSGQKAESESGPESEPESEPESGPEAGPESNPESEPESEPEGGSESGPESGPEAGSSTEAAEETPAPESSENKALYSFSFMGTGKNLNIRSAPSMDAKVIGKIPVGGSGSVLELTDDDWALVEYDGIVGYCSRRWIEMQEITE